MAIKTTLKRYAGPDDPIYSGGLQMSFHNRSRKSTTTSPNGTGGATQEMLQDDSQVQKQTGMESKSSTADQNPSKELPDPVDELFDWVASQESASENNNPTQPQLKKSNSVEKRANKR